MSTSRMLRSAFVVVAVFVTAACGDDGAPSQDGTSSGTSSGGSTTTSGSGTTSGTTADATGTSTGPSGPKACKRPCDLPATCCPAGQENCPDVAYPGNYGCFNDVCVPPQCNNDDECESVAPGTTCETLSGLTLCVEVCETDPSVCDVGTRSCLPTLDDGRRFCRDSCTNGAVFCTPGTTCDEASGLCLCDADADCPGEFLCRP